MEDDNTPSVACDAERSEMQLSDDTDYKYEDHHSRAFVTADSEIPENLLHLSHSFGYDSRRRANLQLLDDRTLIFMAGNLLVLLDIFTKKHRYLRSCSGGGIGCIAVHPTRKHFVAAEKGNRPNIIVYEYSSLRLSHILTGGTEQAYSCVEFNSDGSLLASGGGGPDYTLTVWKWRQEEVMLSCKAISQDVYRVSFSPYKPGLLTSSGSGHIKFWKMANTFSGLKLQGLVGHFGKTAATDIEGFVELPDGKVVSGTDWGNLLLWDGNTIKVEICRKEGRSCHAGMVQPFGFEDGLLMTIGSDGVVRGWEFFQSIDAADGDGSMFEMEPVTELVVGHNVCLSSVVKSPQTDAFIWFAQDSGGSIWKLDLSLTNLAADPECLFSFHAGAIQGLDVSRKSHLMATTSLDRSVKVFDFLANRELTTSRFNHGGTALSWAPPSANQSGGLLVTGFEDGVVRLLELYDPQRLHEVTGRSHREDANLRLHQAFKPHNAPVTALAYGPNGDILATGGSDCTVFFFAVGEKYSPMGFVRVPGPVQSLEWSPPSHSENMLLILCQSGHVVEVQSPDLGALKSAKSFLLSDLPSRSFRFRSIKSQLKREEEIKRRQAVKEKKKRASGELFEDSKQPKAEQEEEEEEEEELPPLYIPDPPSPLYCGFYSQPGQFWLSVGGFDSGFLYHCKFPEKQDEDPNQRQDEPFGFLPIDKADDDPICSVTFSSNRQLLLCGMYSGSIRVYPLQPDDHNLTSMQAYWALNVHDNHYGHLRHIRCSHDDQFVLTAGDDGNIFSFSLLPPEELQRSLQRRRARVPSPRRGFENETLAQDIEDPAAYSIETAAQMQEKNQLQQEAELKIGTKLKKLAELQKKFKQVLLDNQKLPEQVRLTPEELQLHPCFSEEAERLKSQQIVEVRTQLAWEEERCGVALSKLQDWFSDSLETSVVTVVAIGSDHRVSTYRLPMVTEVSGQLQHQSTHSQPDGARGAAPERRKSRAEPAADGSEIGEEEPVSPAAPRPAGIKLGHRQVARLQKAAEKAERARVKIEKRKQEWAQLYAKKPCENYEDPQDVQAIREARENIGDLKLKTAKDFTVPKHLRMTTEKKRAELKGLEENIREKQMEMNGRIVALRDSKLRLVSQLRSQAERLHEVQRRLAARLRRPPPVLPTVQPEETPEKRLQYDDTTMQMYRALREQRSKVILLQEVEEEEDGGTTRLLEKLEKEMENKNRRGEDWTSSPADSSVTREEEETVEEEAELSELEEELHREEEIRLLYQQDSLLEQMESSVNGFDAELMLLRHQKLHLDCQLKLADLRQLTLYQELLLLKELEEREEDLQEKLNGCMEEENSIVSELEECHQELEVKQRDIAKLQEREKALSSAFQASLGENNKFEEFLTRVFRKKVKRVRNKEQSGNAEEKGESDEDSDEDDDWDDDDDDDYDSSTEEGAAGLDDSVCPPGCEPQLFEKTLQLRERRLDLEERLVEEKKRVDVLRKECDALTKKEKVARSSRMVVEDDVELVNREKQEKMNELDVVVPLRLHQIEFVVDGSLPSDLSSALVVDRTELSRLQQRIKQLQLEKSEQRDLKSQARKHHARLIQDCRDMRARIKELERGCNELMMRKFGRLVDLEALQTQSGSRMVEELKQKKILQEMAHARELKEWDVKVKEAREALTEATKYNTEILFKKKQLIEEMRELDHKINAKQKKQGRQFQDHRRREDQEKIRGLQTLVKKQSHQAEALRREIDFLSRKGGSVLPPLDPAHTPTDHTPTDHTPTTRPKRTEQDERLPAVKKQ